MVKLGKTQAQFLAAFKRHGGSFSEDTRLLESLCAKGLIVIAQTTPVYGYQGILVRMDKHYRLA